MVYVMLLSSYKRDAMEKCCFFKAIIHSQIMYFSVLFQNSPFNLLWVKE